ncbi:hypothetical protein BUALT_Bualt03G0140000 [Buddleja alternifolia]|uniref:Uncharacterized protein n=1 Tax=Buddleja alternifolia TaxID=168488 RepID=A0AAV6XVW2_9LAMI|nr:hypothetical protein BUALT_Bualt03G0140000 [Buddleja alternifolia]
MNLKSFSKPFLNRETGMGECCDNIKATGFPSNINSPTNDYESPLLKSSPHDLVHLLELDTYKEHENPDLENIPSPRIVKTLVPYGVFPGESLDALERMKRAFEYVERPNLGLETPILREETPPKTNNA